MNLKNIYWPAILFAFGLMACTSNDAAQQLSLSNNEEIYSVEVVAHDFIGEESLGRTAIEMGINAAVFQWTERDTIGIFSDLGHQVAFPMKSGTGSKNATFDGGGWALNKESHYVAYYPFRYDNTNGESIDITYWGQSQKGNGNTSHLGDFDYMGAEATIPKDGNVTFDFYHINALLQWNLKIPSAANLTSFSLLLDEELLISKGRLDLKADKPIVEPTNCTSSLSMELNDVSVTDECLEVVLYMMVAPVDLREKTLCLQITNEIGDYAVTEVEGKNFEAGMVYSLSADFSAFVNTNVLADEYRGKVISDKGGELILDALGQGNQYIISADDRKWIQLVSTSSFSSNNFIIQVGENTSKSSRRGFVILRNLATQKTVEYAILQGGQGSFAITEQNTRIPIGVLTCSSRPLSEEHGLFNLVDGDISTYFEADTNAEFNISWEGPYAVPVQAIEYSRDIGEWGMQRMTFHIASDGTDWDGLGWSKIFSSAVEETTIEQKVITCRERFYRLIVSSNFGASTTRVSEFGLMVDHRHNKNITTLSDIKFYAEDFTGNPLTPMGNYFVAMHKTTESDIQWLRNPFNEPDPISFLRNYPLKEYEVTLYPYGGPLPADVHINGFSEYPISAALVNMSYLYPNYIRSIITTNGNGVYTVRMFDPQGNPVHVAVQSTFYGDDGGIKTLSSKDGNPNWASIIEKAIIKYNHIYQLVQNINRLRAEQIVAMFTGDGMSFRIKPNVLNCKQMSDAVRVALQNRLVVVGYFDKQGLDVNGAMAEDGLPYSVMLSNRTDAMFVMRNPKGYNQGGTEGDDGLLHIISNEIVPRNIELYFMYPGQASKSSEVSLKPYTNFNYR